MQKSLQNLQDASDDLMMLDDDSLLIPYQIGDVFISHTQEETQEMLEAAKVGLFKPFYTIIKSLNKQQWGEFTYNGRYRNSDKHLD